MLKHSFTTQFNLEEFKKKIKKHTTLNETLKEYEATEFYTFNLIEQYENSFKLKRIIDYNNGFQPHVSLSLEQLKNEKKIRLDFGFSTFQVCFFIFWEVFILLIFLSTSDFYNPFFPLFFSVPFISMWWERRRVIQEIEAMFA